MKNLTLAIALTLLCGCYTKSKNQFLNQTEQPSVKLPYTAGRVTVTDGRGSVSESTLQVEKMSKRGEQSVQPPVNAEYEKMLTEAAQTYFGGGPDRDVEIRVIKATQRLKTRLLSQTESSECEVEILLLDPTSQKQLASGSGSSEADMQSPSATSQYSEKLYRKTLRDALHRAMVSLSRLGGS